MRAWLRRDHHPGIIIRIIGGQRIFDAARSDLGGKLAPMSKVKEALSLTLSIEADSYPSLILIIEIGSEFLQADLSSGKFHFWMSLRTKSISLNFEPLTKTIIPKKKSRRSRCRPDCSRGP